MQQEQLFLFPIMPDNPTQMEYFWHNLPYAIPGFLTFFIGFSLSLFGALASQKKSKKNKASYYLAFSINCLSVGCLGLMLSSRSIILDKEILLYWNFWLYFFVLLILPSAFHLIYYVTEQKNKIIQIFAYFGWIFVLAGYYSLMNDSAFSGEWSYYSFGKYPKPGLILKIWGVYGGIGYAITLPTMFKQFYNQRISSNVYFFAGLNLLFLLLFSNFPSFMGFPVYPGAYFTFIAMPLLAYGVFRADFLSLNDLLFRRSGIYYFQNTILAITFLALAFSIAFGLSSSIFKNSNWSWGLIPLFSCVATFFLSLLIAGLNPTEKLNQLASISILCLAFYLVQTIIKTIDIPPIVTLRISQIFYLLFLPALSLNVRLLYMTLGLGQPKHILLTDIIIVIICMFTFSDFMFVGYYKYSFGNSISLGFPIKLYFFLTILNVLLILRDWISAKRKKEKVSFNIFVFSLLLSALLLIFSMPASSGFAIYPLGNLQFIPASLIALGIFKYGVLPYDRNVLRISLRIAFFSIGLAPIFFLVVLALVSHNVSLVDSIYYSILLVSPIFLFIFQVLFVFSRPIVNQVVGLINEKNKEHERLALVGQLASGIIHDLKNPMVSIKGFAEMASDNLFSEKEKENYLNLISLEIDRLSDMVYDILDFAKGKINLQLEDVSVEEYLTEIIDFLSPEFKKSSVEIRLFLEKNGVVTLDRNRFRRVILNLFGNAKDAMSVGGILRLEVSFTPIGVIFWISDTGTGIPLDVQKKIFNPFVSSGKKTGTGLGMTIVKSIIEAHNGTINFLSEEGRGTNIFVTLPLKEGD